MGRNARWIVVGVVVLAACFAGARLARRNTGTKRVDARSAAAETSTLVAPAARMKREHAEAEGVAPDAEKKHDPVLVRFLVKSAKDGKPIARAKIVAKPDDVDPVELTTDADGRARMPSANAGRDLLNFGVTAKGFVPYPYDYKELSDDDEEVVNLEPGIPLTGHVFDGPSGAPMEGVRVFACWQDGESICETFTDGDGRFGMDALPTIQEPEIWFRAARHANEAVYYDPRSGPLDVWLQPGGRVRGVVRTKDGALAANARLTLSPGAAHDWRGGRSDTSDEAGAFEFDGLTFGNAYDLTASAEGFTDTVERFVPTKDAPVVTRDLVLGGGASLAVVVRDAAGHLVQDANVLICSGDKKVADGRTGYECFAVAAIVAGKVSVHVWSDALAETSMDVDVGVDEAKRVEIRAPSANPIAGFVVDDTGAPVAGASVSFIATIGCESSVPLRSTWTTEDGAFHAVVPARKGLVIRAHAAGYADRAVTAEPGDGPMRLVLLRAGTVRFRLLPPRALEEDTYVTVRCLDDAGAEVATADQECKADQLSVSLVAPIATVRLTIEARGFLPADRAVRPMLYKDVDLGEVALDDGAVVHGRVVDFESHPLEGAWVEVYGADESADRITSAKSGDDGTFEVRGFAPGVVTLRAEAGGFARANVRVAATKTTTPVVIALRRGGLVRARIVDASGDAVDCEKFEVLDADGAPSGQSLDSTTTSAFAGHLPAGRWRLVATRGDVRAETTVDVVEGATEEVVLRFPR